MSERIHSRRLGSRERAATAVATFVAAFLFSVSGAALAQTKATLDDIAFLAGCWEGDLGDGSTIRETYTVPRGGTMLGNSQVVGGGKTQFFEFIQLTQTDAGVVYRPSPNAEDSVAFPLVKSSATEAVFENAAHDFPQRISYVFDGNSGLTARIEKLNGEKAQSFAMKAVACGGDVHRKALK